NVTDRMGMSEEIILVSNMPLPLNFLNYDVRFENGKIKHTWQTTNEINTSHFVIELSTNGIDFNAVGEIRSRNHLVHHIYNFTEQSSDFETTEIVYYRLKQVDSDGRFDYSKVVTVKLKASKKITLSPIPVKDYLHISTRDANSLSIVTMDGKEVR